MTESEIHQLAVKLFWMRKWDELRLAEIERKREFCRMRNVINRGYSPSTYVKDEQVQEINKKWEALKPFDFEIPEKLKAVI